MRIDITLLIAPLKLLTNYSIMICVLSHGNILSKFMSSEVSDVQRRATNRHVIHHGKNFFQIYIAIYSLQYYSYFTPNEEPFCTCIIIKMMGNCDGISKSICSKYDKFKKILQNDYKLNLIHF